VQSLFNLTTSARIEGSAFGEGYTFLGPYGTAIQTELALSIAKVNTSANSSNSQNKTVAPAILHGEALNCDTDARNICDQFPDIKTRLAVFSVSCDLKAVLIVPNVNTSITVSGISGLQASDPLSVIGVTPTAVLVDTHKALKDLDPGQLPISKGGATISDSDCPSASDSVGVTLTVTSVPRSHVYLYLRKNGLFDDTISMSTDSNGLLSGAESSSVQQITAILTELAQTAGSLVQPGVFFRHYWKRAPAPQSPTPNQKTLARRTCYSALLDQVRAGPVYEIASLEELNRMSKKGFWPIDLGSGVSIVVQLSPFPSAGTIGLNDKMAMKAYGKERLVSLRNGLVAYFPTPAIGLISCHVPDGTTIYLNQPAVLTLYAESQVLDPQRDFLTNPKDTFTFNGGFIVGHKFSSQSSAKTIIDTVTAPVRALIPSVSVQQSTQVQTGGGKPDQTTSTTQTTTGAPKSQ
jgi:hypothetical protein